MKWKASPVTATAADELTRRGCPQSEMGDMEKVGSGPETKTSNFNSQRLLNHNPHTTEGHWKYASIFPKIWMQREGLEIWGHALY